MSVHKKPITEQTYDERQMMKDDVPIPDAERQRREWQAQPLSDRDKDSMMRRKKDLEAKVANGMPTHAEMWRPTNDNVKKNMEWEKRWGKEINELKQINRRLEPSNPEAGRIEYLRKQGEADKLTKWS